MKQGVPQASLRASEAAKRLEPRGHGAKRSPQGRNTAQALAQGGAKVWDDHAELRGAWTRNTPRRKIPFSRAKIVSLQFPRPEIRRILAETGGAHEGRAQCAKQAVVSPVKQGAPRVSLRTSEARRAEVASTRSKAQCAATEHRASEAQSGAKTRSDHAELRGGNTASRQAQQGDHCELWIACSPVHQLVKKSF